MPFSDNLYSADDSDDDLGDSQSLSDELSPTDGYFNRSDMPPNIMVLDPSLDANNTANAKAQEARQEAETYSASQGRSTPSQAQQAGLPNSPSSSQQYTSPRSSPYHFASLSPLPPHPQSSPVSPRRAYHDLYPERSPLLGRPVGPPPAYSPATPSSASLPQSPQSGRGYSTFPQDQLEEGIPQSMGSPPPNEPTESSPLWMRRTRTWRRRAVMQKLLFTLLMLSVAMVIVSSIFRSGHSSRFDKPSKTPSKEPSNAPSDGSPIEQPERPTPSDPKEPDNKLPPSVPGPSGPYCPTAIYRDSDSAFTSPMDSRLYIKEYSDTSETDGYSISIYGEVRLRPIPKNSLYANYGYYTVYVYTSHPDLAVQRDFDSNDRSLKIRTPRYQKLDTPGPHCISIEVTAWIPEGSQFNDINIETIQLSQRVFEGTNVTVSDLSNFQSITGNIHFPKVDESNPAWRKSPKKKNDYATDETNVNSLQDRFTVPKLPDLPALPGMPNYRGEVPDFPEVPDYNYSSRRITVSTVVGSIRGGYPLYDYLGISSSSGSVSVAVSPQKISPEKPAPAELEVETKSSSVQVTFPIHGPAWMLPPRDYITSVKAISGSLHGSYITGSRGVWSTESGSVNIEVLPIIEISRDKNELQTYTSTGSSRIDLLEPIFIPKRAPVFVDKEPPAVPDQSHVPFVPIGNDDPYDTLPNVVEESVEESTTLSKLRSLISSHTSRSGTVNLSYPSAWEGIIQATTVTGSINVQGSDIEIIKDGRRDWVHKEVVARKPKGKDIEPGAVNIESTTGNINFSA